MKKLLIAAVMALVTLALPLGAQVARADSNAVDFESPTYSTGNPNGQDGWMCTGCNPNDANYDAAIDSSNGVSGFGDQSLRMSNAVTSGSFGDWVFSKPLANEAGESTADNGGYSGGTRQDHFDALFDIASQTGDTQPGLQISVSPDRGDGARMSFLRFQDNGSGGTDVIFSDYEDQAPFGTNGNPSDGCNDGAEDGFVSTTIATISDSAPHEIELRMDFPDGPRNDVVKVYVDGSLVHTGTSWEDFYRYCGDVPSLTSRTVDSLLFQARTSGGPPAPDTLGHGFLIDNMNLESSQSNDADLSVSQTDSPDPVNGGNNVLYHVSVTNNGPYPADGVLLEDYLNEGDGGALVSATPDDPENAVCYETEGGGGDCNFGTVQPGETRTADVVWQAPGTVEGTSITNNANVSADNNDPDGENNHSEENTQVDPAGQGSGGNQGSTGYIPPDGGNLTTDPGTGATPDDPTVITLKLGEGPGGVGSIDELDQCSTDPDLGPCVGDIGNFNPPPGYDKITAIMVYDRSAVAGGLMGNRKHWHILYQKNGVTHELEQCGPNPVHNNQIPCWKQVIRLSNHDLRVRAFINSDPKLATRK